MRRISTGSAFPKPVFITFQSYFSSMKKTVLSLTACFILLSLLSSCKKEDTKSFKDQLVGHWESVRIQSGASDITATAQFKLNLESSNEFDLDVISTPPLGNATTISYSGDWFEDDTKQDLSLKYDHDGSTITWDVKEITETLMTTEYIEKGFRYEIKFERK